MSDDESQRMPTECEEVAEADVRLVASFRLPVAVKGLLFISDWLRTQYGDGLTMRQHGEFLFIERPRGSADREMKR